MVKKRVRAARAMVMRVVGDDEGNGNRGNMVRRNNDNGLVPVVVQQAVLYSASATLINVGKDKSTGRQLAYARNFTVHQLKYMLAFIIYVP